MSAIVINKLSAAYLKGADVGRPRLDKLLSEEARKCLLEISKGSSQKKLAASFHSKDLNAAKAAFKFLYINAIERSPEKWVFFGLMV